MVTSPTGPETEQTKRRYVRPRPYPQLVTQEAEPDEDLVYGNATPVIVEWRRVRGEFLGAGDRLSKAIAEERMRELEIEMIGKRDLRLPPATYPWDWSDGRDEVWRRRRSLEEARVKRNRALLHRRLRRHPGTVAELGTLVGVWSAAAALLASRPDHYCETVADLAAFIRRLSGS